MRMAYHPSDFIGHELRYSCTKCQRSGSMPAAGALARYGNKALPELRYDFAREFGCERGPNAPFNDKCAIRYDSSAEKMLGIEVPPPEADHERALGELAQYEALFALCLECNRRKPIDRWGIQKKVGKGLTLAQLAGLMRCKCGHKGALLMVRHLSRD
ncbi:hypothetical protein [Rhizobium sp. 57MFTsu3.2]|uniref:hypothetical protein n=1 Tax=Rhizobium sp. 57MFTsu3.2 TaxID=1048681 RepID=UPI00146E2855|nr:hypothetical protein [Rhizobium sp. 57MFTsu3.2]NMN74221.1 hypothetical protein [Rhizobium sp. 57MFTsu3.2]